MIRPLKVLWGISVSGQPVSWVYAMKTAVDLMEVISSIYLKNFEALGDIKMNGELINSANNRPINTTDLEADKSGVVCLFLIRLK